MPQPEESHARRGGAGAKYSYRRPLSLGELMPAIGVAIGAGFFAFYVTRLLLERTPLEVEPLRERPRSPRVRTPERMRNA